MEKLTKVMVEKGLTESQVIEIIERYEKQKESWRTNGKKYRETVKAAMAMYRMNK